jgi:signal transduction histidine kinase
LLVSVAFVAAVSGVVELLYGHAPSASLGALYVLAILPIAVVWGMGFGLLVSVMSTAAFDFMLLPPRHTFTPDAAGDWLGLAVFLTTAAVVSQLAARMRQRGAEVGRLATEQLALRRVATLVAQGAPSSKVFETVTREVGRLSGADLARLERYEADGTVTGVAGWSREGDRELAVGTRLALEGVSIAAMVRDAGGPVRVDSFARASGPIAQEARALGIRSSVGCPISLGGRVWGVIAASSRRDVPFPAGTESQIAEFTELVATAIANAESRAELAASRARIVASTDEARRRIERDLHDGVQQRLITIGLELQGVKAAPLSDQSSLVSNLEDEVRAVLDQVREVSRGVHPVILSQGGLGPALRMLARRSALPVELEVGAAERLPEPVEVAAYYVVSEGLANAAKYSGASVVRVALAIRDGTLHLSVRDDGVGGADPTRGSGIVGLTDRVEALGGTLVVTSPPDEGTSIVLEMPVELD